MTILDDAALKAALPALSGDLRVPGLAAPVKVYRDHWGIPHIRASGSDDAWFALGFVHAQDRLFQMDLNRLRALGRSAEWLGEAAVDADILVRRLGMRAACQRDYAALEDDARVMLDSYSAGVNAFLRSGAPLPIEYRLLEVVSEAWEPWHSIAVMRRLGLLMGSVWFKLWRMLALPVIGADAAMTLRYDDAGADLLTVPPGMTAARWEADLAALAPAVCALLQAMGQEETGGGSNNWAVGPKRSATGRPVLSGDPHRVFEIPGMYAQHHLACEDFDMIGLSVPGVPGFPHYGHNGRVAYCVTHAFVDIHDLFLERFDETGSQVLFGEAWEPVATHTERLDVRDGAPREIEVVVTRHGPVIAGDPRSGAALALRSVQFAETDLSFDCLPRMTQADTVASLYEATRGWGLIDHNLVAGDIAGSIGQRVRALVPRRPRTNGWLPVPGWTGAHEWDGWVPYEAMPSVIDPASGVIVTANNRVAADDGPDYLCTDCHPPYRAQRILERIEALAAVSPGDADAIHADVLSPHVKLMHGWLARIAPLPDMAAEALRNELLAWDGQMRADTSSSTAYMALRRAITMVVASRSNLSDVGKHAWAAVPPGVIPMNQLWWAVPNLMRRDDTRLLNGWNWEQVLIEALQEASSATGIWGKVHQPRFVHPLSGHFPGAATLLNPPSLPIGGDTDTVQANGISAATGLEATYGAIARYVYDVGNWDACRWAVFHGTSGHPGSTHYTDQNLIWSRCEMIPMLYSWPLIAAESKVVQNLSP
jgi:penicillin G amidase